MATENTAVTTLDEARETLDEARERLVPPAPVMISVHVVSLGTAVALRARPKTRAPMVRNYQGPAGRRLQHSPPHVEAPRSSSAPCLPEALRVSMGRLHGARDASPLTFVKA